LPAKGLKAVFSFVFAGRLPLCRWHMLPASYGLCAPSLYRTGLANVRPSMKTYVTIGRLNVFSNAVEHCWCICSLGLLASVTGGS
jgi:hypothetical protein